MMSEGIRPNPERVGEFGPAMLMELPYSAVNVLRQIRNTFDQEKLDELADSLHYRGDSADGHRRYDLLQPPSVGIHTPESAHIYLEQLNAAWDTNYCLGDLTIWPSVDGPRYAILIAGERRYRSVGLKIHQDGLSADSLLVCAADMDPDFKKAFPRQFVENNARVNPPPQDEARAIRVYADVMRQYYASLPPDENGKQPRFTQKMCAEAFSINPDKVRQALIFTDYPDCMQELIERWSFRSLIEAQEIYELYRDHYQEKVEAGELLISADGSLHLTSPQEVATYEVETCLLRVKAEALRRRANPTGRQPIDVRLSTQAQQIKDSFSQHQLNIGISGVVGLEEIDDMKSRRDRATHGLFGAAYGALELLQMIGGLTDDMKHKIGGLAIISEMKDVVDDEAFESALVEKVA